MAKVILEEQKLNHLIRRTIIETIQEIFRDPDYGLELQGWVKERLRKRPKNLAPFEEIKRKYG